MTGIFFRFFLTILNIDVFVIISLLTQVLLFQFIGHTKRCLQKNIENLYGSVFVI